MGTYNTIPKDIKQQILSRIKNDGISVIQASKDHGVSPKTIYNWLNRQLEKTPSYREYSALKQQNKQLIMLIGQLTLEINKLKKIEIM